MVRSLKPWGTAIILCLKWEISDKRWWKYYQNIPPAGDLLSCRISKELFSYLLVGRQFSKSGTKWSTAFFRRLSERAYISTNVQMYTVNLPSQVELDLYVANYSIVHSGWRVIVLDTTVFFWTVWKYRFFSWTAVLSFCWARTAIG